MFRKTMLAVAAVALGLSATAAEARGGFHGGFHGGFYGGHFRHYAGGFRSGPWVGAYGFGFAVPYYGLGYDNYYGYPGNYDENEYEGCHVARERIRTRHGWRVRSIDICE